MTEVQWIQWVKEQIQLPDGVEKRVSEVKGSYSSSFSCTFSRERALSLKNFLEIHGCLLSHFYRSRDEYMGITDIIVFSYNEIPLHFEVWRERPNEKIELLRFVPREDNKRITNILSSLIPFLMEWIKTEGEDRIQYALHKRELFLSLETYKLLPADVRKKYLPNESIRVLELTVRGYNCLQRAGIYKVSQFLALSKEEFMKIPFANNKTVSLFLEKQRKCKEFLES